MPRVRRQVVDILLEKEMLKKTICFLTFWKVPYSKCEGIRHQSSRRIYCGASRRSYAWFTQLVSHFVLQNSIQNIVIINVLPPSSIMNYFNLKLNIRSRDHTSCEPSPWFAPFGSFGYSTASELKYSGWWFALTTP
jgi:hypothetical protein